MGLSFVRARKSVKASRATEQGIAGHQAAMKALGSDSYSGFESGKGHVYVGEADKQGGSFHPNEENYVDYYKYKGHK